MRNTLPAAQRLEQLESRVLMTVGGSYVAPFTPRVTINENPGWSVNGGATVTLPYVRDATNGGTGTDTFTKTIAATSDMIGKKVYLHFEGAFLTTSLSIDGTAVDLNPATAAIDSHKGGFQAFDFDISSRMQIQGNHTFVITVASGNDNNVSPGSGGDYFRQGGIYRDLSIRIVNPTQIAVSENVGHIGLANQAADTTSQISSPGVRFSNDDVTIGIASTTVHVTTVLNDLSAAAQNVTVTSYLVDAGGITRAQGTTTRSLAAGQIGSTVTQDMTVANPHLWDGRIDPYLYTLHVEVRDAASNQLLDTQKQKVGIRTFKINNPASAAEALTNPPFVLNGHAYRVVGVDVHQDTGALDSRGNPAGWERSDAQTRADVDLVLNMGATAIRTAHYQESQALYDYCDKVGILIYTEMGINGSVANNDAFAANAEDQFQEIVRQNYNHASVFAWGFANETSDSTQSINIFKQFQKIAKGTTVTNSTTGVKTVVVAQGDPTPLDPNRYTAFATYGNTTPSYTSNGNGTSSPSNLASISDILGTHPYTYWYGGNGTGPAQQLLQPQGVTEYSGGGAPYQYTDNTITLPVGSNPGGVTTVYHPENTHARINELQYTQLTNLGYLWGQFTWQMFDHPDGKTEGDITHTNDKGLVTRDRVPKDSYYFYQAALNDPTRNYANNRVLKLSDRFWTVRNQAAATITVFSNVGVPTVSVNGIAVPMQQLVVNGVSIINTYVNSSTVTLSQGSNRINVTKTYTDGKTYTDSAVWTLRSTLGAGSTSTARIDFAPSGTTPAAGYSLDSGATYGARNGQTYGWLPAGGNVLALQSTSVSGGTASTSFSVGTTTLSKDGINLSYDLQSRKSSVWEYALNNGTYDVRIGSGRSGATDGVNNFSLEGVTATIDTNGERTQDTQFARVVVKDGKLTLAAAPGAFNERITFIDINLVTPDADPTVVSQVTVNGGDIQRSVIQSLALTFNRVTTLQSNAVSLSVLNGATYSILTSNPSGDGLNYVLTLGSGAALTSLPDGVYTLSVDNTKVSNMTAAYSFKFHHLFGDGNGDRSVDADDAVLFGSAKGSFSGDSNYNSAFDFDGDGDIDALDSLRFRQHQGQSVSY